MIKFDKLVRDRIPEIIEREGAVPSVYQVEGEELLNMILAKLHEECDELHREQNIEEMADVLEVLMACSNAMGVSWLDVEHRRQAKRRERGGFDQGLVLRWVKEN